MWLFLPQECLKDVKLQFMKHCDELLFMISLITTALLVQLSKNFPCLRHFLNLKAYWG